MFSLGHILNIRQIIRDKGRMHQFCLFEKTSYKVDNDQIFSQKQGIRGKH